jgi:hypothetical protein
MLPYEPESITKSVLLWTATIGAPLVIAVAILYGTALLVISWLLALSPVTL